MYDYRVTSDNSVLLEIDIASIDMTMISELYVYVR